MNVSWYDAFFKINYTSSEKVEAADISQCNWESPTGPGGILCLEAVSGLGTGLFIVLMGCIVGKKWNYALTLQQASCAMSLG